MLKSNYEFEVLIHGSSAKEYYHKGSYYIEGKEGTHFSLRMRNNSSQRALFVPTVDGLSIMNGKEASFKSRGYIVNAHDSVTIDGWRTSDDRVAQFFFSSPKQSYAKRMNRGSNLGIIGCAVFREKKPEPQIIERIKIIEKEVPTPVYPKHWPWPQEPIYPRWAGGGSASGGVRDQEDGFPMGSHTAFYSSTAGLNGNLGASGSGASMLSGGHVGEVSSLSMKSVKAGLGTGFGEEKNSPVITVEFEKEERPVEVFSVYYNTREVLEEMGVEFRKPVYVTPSAFPNEDGYCERPN